MLKAYRISRIFGNSGLGQVKITDEELLGILAFLVSIEISTILQELLHQYVSY